MSKKTMDERPGYRLICRNWITTRTGRRIYAWQYGKEAFCFWVKV